MFNRSLTYRLFIINLIFLVIPALMVLGFFFNKSGMERKIDTLYHMCNLAYSKNIYIEEHVDSCENILSLLINTLHLNTPDIIDHKSLLSSFKQILQTAPSLDNIIYTQKNDKGQFLVSISTNYDTDKDLTNYSFITSALKEGSSMTLGSGPKGAPWIFITRIIKSKNQEVIGTLTIAQDPNNLLSKISDTSYFILGTSFSLMNDAGIYFAGNDPALILTTFEPLTPLQIAKLNIEGIIATPSIIYHPITPLATPILKDVFEREGLKGKTLNIKWPIVNSNAFLIVTIEENKILNPFYEYKIKICVIILFIILVSSLIIWFLAKVLSEPLDQFLNIMQEVSKGNLEVRFVTNEVGYEINVLGERTNSMLVNLKVLLEEIRNEPIKQIIASQELKIGHQIQQKMLPPPLPFIPQLAIAAIENPAIEVGGDFYDVFLQNQDHNSPIFVTVADGAGKGIPACLYALCLRTLLRSYATLSGDVALAVEKANNLFCEDTKDSSMFVTLFMGVFTPDDLKFSYYAAGHPPALVRHSDGSVEKLGMISTPLGISNFTGLRPQTIQLLKGDILLLYTDGITEEMNPLGVLYGEERLINFLKKMVPTTPQLSLDALITDIESFRSTAQQHDDITALLIYIT